MAHCLRHTKARLEEVGLDDLKARAACRAGPTDPKRREEEVLGTLLLICGDVHMPRLGPSCLVLFLPRMLLHPYIHLAGNVTRDENTSKPERIHALFLLKDGRDIVLYR